MRSDRIEKLALFIRDEVEDKHFSMNKWATKEFLASEGPDLCCCSAACALAWGTRVYPELSLEPNDCSLQPADVVFFTENGNKVTDFHAAEAFFELTQDEACYLFDPGDEPHECDPWDDTPEDQATRMLAFIEDGIDEDWVDASLGEDC